VRARSRASVGAKVFSLLAMIIVEEINRNTTIPAGSEEDTVAMGWQDRRSTRRRIETRKGREIAIALPTGTVLMDGDVLYIGDGFHILVEAEEEEVLVSILDDPTISAFLAYELGNRHLPVAIGHDRLATPYDRLVEDLFSRSGTKYERRIERFEPARVKDHHHG